MSAETGEGSRKPDPGGAIEGHPTSRWNLTAGLGVSLFEPGAAGAGGDVEDAEGFATFYAANHAHVHGAVRLTVGDPQLARDATDEAFVRAAERWRTVGTGRNPQGWTYRVAVNWATSWRRKWGRRPSRPTDELDRDHHDTLPDVDLDRALSALPVRDRQLLVLRFLLDLSIEETAEVLGMPVGSVKSRVHRVRQRLVDEQEVLDGRA